MRIEIPSRKFFMTVAVIFALLLIGGAFAVYDPAKGSHDILWTDRIEPKTGTKVIVAGDLEVTGSLLSGAPAGNSLPPEVVSIECDWTGWSDTGSCGGGRWTYCSRQGAIRLFCSSGMVVRADMNGCYDCGDDGGG